MLTAHRRIHASSYFWLPSCGALFKRAAREKIITVHPSPQPCEGAHTSRAGASARFRAFWNSSRTTAAAPPTATPPTTSHCQAGPVGPPLVSIVAPPVLVLVLVLMLMASVITRGTQRRTRSGARGGAGACARG